MENSVMTNITYTLESCHNPNAPFRLRDWVTDYELLSEYDMRILAHAFKFNKRSVEKLVTGPKGFRYIKKKGYEMLKVIHKTQVECRSVSDKRQPANMRMRELLERIASNRAK